MDPMDPTTHVRRNKATGAGAYGGGILDAGNLISNLRSSWVDGNSATDQVGGILSRHQLNVRKSRSRTTPPAVRAASGAAVPPASAGASSRATARPLWALWAAACSPAREPRLRTVPRSAEIAPMARAVMAAGSTSSRTALPPSTDEGREQPSQPLRSHERRHRLRERTPERRLDRGTRRGRRTGT